MVKRYTGQWHLRTDSHPSSVGRKKKFFVTWLQALACLSTFKAKRKMSPKSPLQKQPIAGHLPLTQSNVNRTHRVTGALCKALTNGVCCDAGVKSVDDNLEDSISYRILGLHNHRRQPAMCKEKIESVQTVGPGRGSDCIERQSKSCHSICIPTTLISSSNGNFYGRGTPSYASACC